MKRITCVGVVLFSILVLTSANAEQPDRPRLVLEIVVDQLRGDPNAPKADRFITLGGEPFLIRYNNRLPVVVYVPEGVEVRYRIWHAGAESRTIEEG